MYEKLYFNRFKDAEKQKNLIWKTLCDCFFNKIVCETDTVLDLAAGYCEFINNIKANNKIALDINSAVHNYADKDVNIIISSAEKIDLKDAMVDMEHFRKTKSVDWGKT